MPFFSAQSPHCPQAVYMLAQKGWKLRHGKLGAALNSDWPNLSLGESLVFDAGELAGEGQGSALEESERDW